MRGADTKIRRKKIGSWIALLSLLLSTLGITLATVIPQGASATLPGSTFNGLDATPDVPVTLADPTQGADITNYSNGAKDDTICPGDSPGTAPNKDDLDNLYFAVQNNPAGVFLYLGWHRITTQGTTTVEFELNQSKLHAPCVPDTGLPARTAGDLLILYDFTGGGGVVTIHKETWIGNSAAGTWSAPVLLSSPAVETSVNAAGDFGEVVLNGTDPTVALFPLGTCETFAQAFARTRSAVGANPDIKDFTFPMTGTVSNCGHIDIKKVDDTPGTPLAVPGATFTLYTDVGGSIGVPVVPAQTCTTDAGGLCTIKDIIPGTYWLRETTVPAGYNGVADQKVVVTVPGNTPPNPITFIDTRKPGSIEITKQDDTGAALPGAVFTLYTDNAGAIGSAVVPAKTCTSGANGVCTVTGILPPGNYWLRETTTPAGYNSAADVGPITVTLDHKTVVAQPVVDQRQAATINITKTDDAVPPAAVANATFTLYTDNGGVIGVPVAPAKTCTTGAGGTCSLTGILPPGTYWVRETTTPAGYNTAADQQVTVGLGGVVPLSFVDVRKPGKINITKIDDTAPVANKIPGAGFTLYTDNAGVIGVPVAPANTCTTNAAGECSLSNILPAGTYWVRETTTPPGYNTAADQKVTVGLDQTVALTFTNVRQPATIAITKTDDAVPAAAVPGAVFTLYTDNAGVIGVPVVPANTCTTDGTGHCNLSNILPPGTYWVRETTTPPGYNTAADQKVTVTLGHTSPLTFVDVRQPATIQILKTDDAVPAAPLSGATFTLFTDNAGVIGVPVVPAKSCTTNGLGLCQITGILPPGTYWVRETTVPAGYTGAADQKVTLALGQTVGLPIVDVRKPAKINIVKTDDAVPAAAVANATFTLFTDVAGAIGPAVVPANSCTTDALGHCTLSNILPAGTYWVRETTTPPGYNAAPDQKVTLALDQTATLTFVDVRQPATINITKVDDTPVAPLPVSGATFTLFTDNAGVIGVPVVPANTCTTNIFGACSLNNILPPGTYWVRETTTPPGYFSSADQKVTVALGQTVPLTFVNNRKPASITINKVDDAVPAQPVVGAVFTLFTDVAGAIGPAVVPANTCTTGAAGTCTLSNILPPGTYWVRETTTPAGYATAADQKITLALGQTASLNFVDPRLPSSVLVTKTVNGQTTTPGTPLMVEAGSTLNFAITIKNTGLNPLTIKKLTDSLLSVLPISCTGLVNQTLAPGASLSCTYTMVATGNSVLNNTAEADNTDRFNRAVNGQAAAFALPIHPAITMTKTAPVGAHVGDTILYVLTVTNSGDVPLTNLVVTDPKCAAAPVLQSKAGGNQDNILDKGEVWTYNCNHVVTAADGTSLVNTAISGAQDPLLNPVKAQATATVGIAHPAITLVKTANPVSVTPPNPVTYSYLVTNTGDVTLTNVTVNDNVLGQIGVIPSLAPGQSQTLTKSVAIAANSPITNIGTAAGIDPFGTPVSATSTATITIVLAEVLVQPAALPATGAPVDRELRLAGALGVAGLTLLFLTWRRRPEQERNED